MSEVKTPCIGQATQSIISHINLVQKLNTLWGQYLVRLDRRPSARAICHFDVLEKDWLREQDWGQGNGAVQRLEAPSVHESVGLS